MTAKDKSIERPTGASSDARLARLARRKGGLATTDAVKLAWQNGARLPFWLSRHSLAGIVADLRYGETATARACAHISNLLQDSDAARDCLAVQTADEQAHADLYGRYLDLLNVPARANPGLERVFQRCLDWRGHPVALIIAFNLVLEGEALRLQRLLAQRVSCPLFAALNRRIAMDEARHVAFGRIYVPARLTGLDTEQRIATFRWLRSLWWESSGLVLNGLRGPAGVLLRSMQPGPEMLWRRQTATLMRVGLVRPDEMAQAERP